MFTMIDKLHLNNERKLEALYVDEQGYDVVCRNQIKFYWDLCKKRRK